MSPSILCAPILAALLTPAAAQTRPDPTDAKAAVAPAQHRSALSQYRRFGPDAPASGWRDVNDAVERIGGWRAYAREANAPEAAASAPAPKAPERATRPATPAMPAHRH